MIQRTVSLVHSGFNTHTAAKVQSPANAQARSDYKSPSRIFRMAKGNSLLLPLEVHHTPRSPKLSPRDSRSVCRHRCDFRAPSRNPQVGALAEVIQGELRAEWTLSQIGSIFDISKGLSIAVKSIFIRPASRTQLCSHPTKKFK
jgi:hypothetical protein